MRGSTITLKTETDFFIEECCSCHVLFAMTTAMKEERLRTKEWFYCPNGHHQHYTGKSDKQLLREAKEREAAESARAATAEKALGVARTEAARLRKRSAAGVCPCCKRSFVQMGRHMATKHPEYAQTTPK